MTILDNLRNLKKKDIQQFLPNSAPWLFVDEITECVPGEYAKGSKFFRQDEYFFRGHFNEDPNVPGVIQIEVLLQVFLMTFLTLPGYARKKTADVTLNSKLWKRIPPNVSLDVEAILSYFKRGLAKGKSIGYVENEITCETEFEVAIPEITSQFRPRL